MTPPRTKKLFISYRSSDAAKVDKIARDLALLQYDDGTPRYTTWQDKHNLPPATPSWWDAIVDAIIDCDMFVFNLSRASLQSEVCRAELDYARKRNRPIIPLVLDGEFLLNSQSGKYDLPKETWALVPDWLGQAQFLFYVATEFYSRFQTAVESFERDWPRSINAPRPLNPDNQSVHGSNHALYDAACDYAHRLAFADAEKHFDALVRRNDPDYADAAAQWLELIRSYAELIEIVERRSAAFIFKKKWATYEALFPKEFLEGIFDPKGFATRSVVLIPVAPSVGVQPATPTAPVFPPHQSARAVPHLGEKKTAGAKPRSADLLPAPFAWIEIPKRGYSIAKYPLTNAQYRLFIDAGGYSAERWWTQAGWQAREANCWTEPPFWQDRAWDGAEQPVVGVSWFEAVAYCLWLSELTSERIMLPTAEQWQYAAQGDDGRDYPWGKEWDCDNCNNSVRPCQSGATTPVRKYEGKGDSPFGVVDIAGNVWEWCLTAPYSKKKSELEGTDTRVRRGGSWSYVAIDGFRCDYRSAGTPDSRYNNTGIRLAVP